MSKYLCFQQPPWTAGYLAGWPSLLRILNFFLPLKLLFRTQIFSQLKKAKVRQLCLEDIRRLHGHDSLTFSIFENEFVSRQWFQQVLKKAALQMMNVAR